MNILVTGGAGFIGSNFIRQRLLEEPSRLVKLVNLDALTYAGNLDNLRDLTGDTRYVFVHGEIGDSILVSKLLAFSNPLITTANITKTLSPNKAFTPTSLA